MKKLKSLNEHNVAAREFHKIDSSPKLNGLACPKCEAELFDSNPTMTLTSNPPQKNIHCSKCDYVGYRIC